jgi:O-antigen/teichoic acid export membrane protein
VALADLLSETLILLSALTWVRSPEDLVRMPWIYLAGRLTEVIFLAFSFRLRFGPPRLRFDRALIRELLPEALPLFGSSILALLLINFDILLLGLWLDSAQAGYYGAAFRFVQLLRLLSMSYFRAIRPPLAQASIRGPESLMPWLGRAFQLSGAFALGAVVGGTLLAAQLVDLLFGAGYQPAFRPLQLLLVAFGMLVLSRHYRGCLVTFGHQGVNFALGGIATALNLGLNLLLIPRFGILACAWAMVAAEALLLVGSRWAARRLVGPVPGLKLLARPALGAILLAVLLVLLEGWGVAARLVLGAAFYLGLLISLRVLRPRELLPAGTRELAARG